MEVKGEPIIFFETGMEGSMWAIEPPNARSPGDVGLLEAGDNLTIWDKAGEVIFQGTVDPDRKAAMTQNPVNPDHRQPSVFGIWVHWIQRGWDPEAWAGMFTPHKGRSAVLIKSQENAQKLRDIELRLRRSRGVPTEFVDEALDTDDDRDSVDSVEYTPSRSQ